MRKKQYTWHRYLRCDRDVVINSRGTEVVRSDYYYNDEVADDSLTPTTNGLLEMITHLIRVLRIGPRCYQASSWYRDYAAFSLYFACRAGDEEAVERAMGPWMRRHAWWRMSVTVDPDRHAVIVTLYRKRHLSAGRSGSDMPFTKPVDVTKEAEELRDVN